MADDNKQLRYLRRKKGKISLPGRKKMGRKSQKVNKKTDTKVS